MVRKSVLLPCSRLLLLLMMMTMVSQSHANDPNGAVFEESIGRELVPSSSKSSSPSDSPYGAIVHIRSLPPSTVSNSFPDSNPIQNDIRVRHPNPFQSSHLFALKQLINNTTASDLGLPSDDSRYQLLKYYFMSDLADKSSSGPYAAGTMNHFLSTPKQLQSTPVMPLSETDLRQLINRFSGHPIELLLRRALRATKNGQFKYWSNVKWLSDNDFWNNNDLTCFLLLLLL